MSVTWNEADKTAGVTLSNGDLTATNGSATWRGVRGTENKSSEKWYCEFTVGSLSNGDGFRLGIATALGILTDLGDAYGYGYEGDGQKRHNGSEIAYGDAYTTGDIVSMALDLDNGKIWWAKNGVWQAGGDPAVGTNEAYSGISGTFFPQITFWGGADSVTVNFGSSSFSYSVPSGFNPYETGPEVVLTDPFLATVSLQSSIQREIVAGTVQAESSISVGELFWGTFIESPSPFAAQCSLQAKTGINIAIEPLVVQANLQSNVQVELALPAFTSQSELSVGEVFWGHFIALPSDFIADGSLQSNTQIEIVTVPLISTSALLSNIGIEISAGVLNNTGAILGTPVYPIILTGSKRIYLFTLTGAADGVEDIVIPIKSFQSRLKSGDPTYLSVVIPGIDYASAINLRLNGDLVVRMGYLSNSEIILSEIISIVDFENIIIYDGTTNKTITLDGHRTETFTPKEINLTGSSYKNLTAGKLRYRCTPNLYVRPGDTVNIDDDSFTIENITYSVSPELETFEVSE